MSAEGREKVLPAAEYFFEKGNLDMAMKLAKSVESLEYYVAYSIHKRFSNDRNYYKILKASDPFVDQETLRKGYKSLTLVLHPDKNKSMAANGAFKIVNEAWNVLSDPVDRLKYNHELFKKEMEKSETRNEHSDVKKVGIDPTVDDQSLKEIIVNVLGFLRQNRYIDSDCQCREEIVETLLSFLREKRRTDGES